MLIGLNPGEMILAVKSSYVAVYSVQAAGPEVGAATEAPIRAHKVSPNNMMAMYLFVIEDVVKGAILLVGSGR
jgi:hypothetical protein